jgi:hypothetical protein
MTQIQAWVEAEEGEAVEGNYYAPDASCFRLEPSAEQCPFCRCAMEHVVRTRIFGRIFKDLEERRGGRTRVIVELLPASHEAFKCPNCDTVMTRPVEEMAP